MAEMVYLQVILDYLHIILGYLPDVYKDGFLPLINSIITDFNTIASFRGEVSGIKWDLSNTYGGNKFMFNIDNSANTTYEKETKKAFDAGGHAFYQNTTNLDLSKKIDILEGLNIAAGSEFRSENFQLIKGEEQSYNSRTGSTFSYLYTPIKNKAGTLDSLNEGIRRGGYQVFPGYANNVSKNRTSMAIYGDADLEVTKKWLVGGAIRFENYSDFGSTTNFKLLTGYRVTDHFSVRFAYNTGFRAPSLHQIYFENTTTQLVNGTLTQVGILSNENAAAKALGIPQLKAEQSNGISGGFTADFGKVTLTTDFYRIGVKDRIVFTDAFSGKADGTATEKIVYDALLKANASVAQFFVNAINSVTKGLDVVLTYKDKIQGGDFRADLAFTYSKTQQDGDVNNPATLTKDNVFPTTSKMILENISPVIKGSLGLNYSIDGFTILLRNSYFGEVVDPNISAVINGVSEYQISEARVITDLSVSYKFNKHITATIGSNNLLDIYPTPVNKQKFPDGYDNGRFRFQNASSQFGYNGRFIFTRISITL